VQLNAQQANIGPRRQGAVQRISMQGLGFNA
jgi:hypothetical protein